MKRFTKEQIETLSQWEDSFLTATVGNYYRNISSKALNAIKEVYEAATGIKSTSDFSCNHCILSFLKNVGKKYYEDKKAIEELAAQLVSALDETFKEVPDEPEPKVKKASAKTATKKPANKATKKK